MNQKSNAFLETQPIGGLMRKYAIPCIISLLVAALYNIVDQIFIANADYLGSFGNAANTVVFPLTVIALAIATMIGDGCCAFVSISLGASENESAHKSIGTSILVIVVSSIALVAVYLLFQNPILNAFGAAVNENTFKLSKEYFTFISLGIPFYMFGQAMNPIIRSDGSPRFAMVSLLAGSILNMILDPIFIFVLHWGMTGAAVATVFGQMLGAALAIYYLFHMKAVQLRKESFHFAPKLLGKFIPLGATSFLTQISVVLSMAAVLNMIKKYGALDPVFGQTEYAQIPTAVVGIVALAVFECFPGQLIGLFGATNESTYYTDFAIRCIRIFLCMIILSCINKGVTIFLQSLGRAKISTMLSVLREIICGVGLPLLLPVFFGLDGILYFMAWADVITFVVSVFVLIGIYKELNNREKEE